MIWQKKHMSQKAFQGGKLLQRHLRENRFPVEDANEAFNIGIVGGGPKGLYALDRLIVRADNIPSSLPIDIYWFNETQDYGCGPNYQVDQPEYLLINYCIGNIDGWDRCEIGKNRGNKLNLVDWLKKFNNTTADIRPTDYASRALVGCYLQYVTALVIQSLPTHMRLFMPVGEVVDIDYSNRFQIILGNSSSSIYVDNLLLTTGHSYSNEPLLKQEQTTVEKNLPNYFPNVYPVHSLNRIPGESRVGIAGMGLTFIDAALHLTEGRGGAFDKSGNYSASGSEPVIYPFSRNNLPILPRGPVYASEKYQLHYLDEPWVNELTEIRRKRKIDFFKEILPLLRKEAEFAYYSTLLRTREAHEIEAYTNGLSEGEKFRLEHLLFPSSYKRRRPDPSFMDILEENIHDAELGELQSPNLAAAAVWREATPIIGEIYRHGGFTGESQKRFDKEFLGAFCRTSFGPPVENMKKILALTRAGIVRFEFDGTVDIDFVPQNGTYLLRSTNNVRQVDFLVDARVARPALKRRNSPLYDRLWKRRIVEPFDNQGYQPGCVKIDENGQVTTNSPGNLPMFLYGSNTEGVMLDNDSLSRLRNDMSKSWADFCVSQILQSKTLQDETTC